jgi:hypothetical protein
MFKNVISYCSDPSSIPYKAEITQSIDILVFNTYISRISAI